MAMGGEETYHLNENSLQEPAVCSYIKFSSTEPNENLRTGYPMVTRLGFLAQRDLENVAFNVLIYWPSGYLCAQLTTSISNPQLQIKRGSGEVEFCCPALEIQPGWYRVDISIESNGNCLDRQQHCAVLRVHPGKIVLGDFYMDTVWRVHARDQV
jgi:hypothetical protein